MSKVAGELIGGLGFLDLSGSSYELLVEIEGGNSEKSSIKAIDFIDVDEDEKECLLVICPDDEPIEITGEIRGQISNIPELYKLYACYEINMNDGLAKVKLPVKGFRVDEKKSRFIALCGLNK